MTNNHATDVFRAETDHGHAFKIFIEMLHGLGFTRCTFSISKTGIISREMDQGKKILCDFDTNSQKFKFFRYNLPEKEVHLQFNVSAFKKIFIEQYEFAVKTYF